VTLHVSNSTAATEKIGRELAPSLQAGDIVLLEGDLAAGKTALVRGLVLGLGGSSDDVSSPTFVLVQSYPCDSNAISILHHVDLYRLADRLSDLRELGLEDVLSDPHAVVAVEWPKEQLATWIPNDARIVRVTIRILDGDDREIAIGSSSF
jgi:tRNA threonylcarbamoyl adenosine modification protein YjeE